MNAKLFRRLKTNSDFFPQYASSPTLSTNTLASVCIALICTNTGPSIALNLPSSLHWVEALRSPFLTPTGLKHSARPSILINMSPPRQPQNQHHGGRKAQKQNVTASPHK